MSGKEANGSFHSFILSFVTLLCNYHIHEPWLFIFLTESPVGSSKLYPCVALVCRGGTCLVNLSFILFLPVQTQGVIWSGWVNMITLSKNATGEPNTSPSDSSTLHCVRLEKGEMSPPLCKRIRQTPWAKSVNALKVHFLHVSNSRNVKIC